MTHEEWRVIPGFPCYEVSNMGRVRSWKSKGDDGGPKVLAPRTANTGHHVVSLHTLGVPHRIFVHRLVLEAFVSPREEGQFCRHLNSMPSDNRVENLRWGTLSENQRDAVMFCGGNRGHRNGMATLTNEQVLQIKRMLLAGVLTNSDLGRLFKVSQVTISRIKTGKRWGWLSLREIPILHQIKNVRFPCSTDSPAIKEQS